MSADIQNAAESPRAVRVPAGAVVLAGEIHAQPAPAGLVLLAHCGGGAAGSPHQPLARRLRGAGLATVTLDLLTAEEGAADLARGHLRQNIGLLTQRLVCASHWVGGEDEARHQRLGFLASGTCAAAALVAAADLGRSIGAVVVESGRPDLAGGALRRVKCPVLLLVSQHDEEAEDYNAEALELLNCPKELHRIPGTPPAGEDVARPAADWFLEHLGHSTSARFRR
jgi:hypothetical protein